MHWKVDPRWVPWERLGGPGLVEPPGLRPLGQKSLSGSPPSKPQGNYRILCVPQGEEGWEALV